MKVLELLNFLEAKEPKVETPDKRLTRIRKAFREAAEASKIELDGKIEAHSAKFGETPGYKDVTVIEGNLWRLAQNSTVTKLIDNDDKSPEAEAIRARLKQPTFEGAVSKFVKLFLQKASDDLISVVQPYGNQKPSKTADEILGKLFPQERPHSIHLRFVLGTKAEGETGSSPEDSKAEFIRVMKDAVSQLKALKGQTFDGDTVESVGITNNFHVYLYDDSEEGLDDGSIRQFGGRIKMSNGAWFTIGGTVDKGADKPWVPNFFTVGMLDSPRMRQASVHTYGPSVAAKDLHSAETVMKKYYPKTKDKFEIDKAKAELKAKRTR